MTVQQCNCYETATSQTHKTNDAEQSYVKRDNSILLMITTVFYYSFIKE